MFRVVRGVASSMGSTAIGYYPNLAVEALREEPNILAKLRGIDVRQEWYSGIDVRHGDAVLAQDGTGSSRGDGTGGRLGLTLGS